jgi:acyl carrier protein
MEQQEMSIALTQEGESHQPPGVTERAVAALWSEVLQTAELPDAADDFFALGGDSMAMIMLEFRIKEQFSVELPVGAVLAAPTLRELSALVAAASDGSWGRAIRSVEPSDIRNAPDNLVR